MNETIRHGLRSFYFLIPMNTQCTFSELAKMIRAYNSNIRAAIIADALETTTGTVTYDGHGLRAKWVARETLVRLS